MLNINKFNYPFTLKQKSFLENFFKFAPPYIQTVLMLRSYKKDSRLVAAGDSCAHVYILLKGRLEAVEEHVANIPYHFTEIRALDIVGDYEFFTEKQPRLVTLDYTGRFPLPGDPCHRIYDLAAKRSPCPFPQKPHDHLPVSSPGTVPAPEPFCRQPHPHAGLSERTGNTGCK